MLINHLPNAQILFFLFLSHGIILPSEVCFARKQNLRFRVDTVWVVLYYILFFQKHSNVVLGRFKMSVRNVQHIALFACLSIVRKLDLF